MQDDFIDDQPPIGTLTDDARESLRLAIADTPADHPDRARHTPGPWALHDISYGIRIGDIAWIGFGSAYPKEEHRANARLIAAAPSMLDALEEIARLPIAGSYPDGPCLERQDMNMVRAAIAKATVEDTP
jgi:hypothetical protein